MSDGRPVVAAVIVSNLRVLLTQRSPTRSYSWQWECPGGKVEEGETAEAALVRELREELGVRAAVGPMLWQVHALGRRIMFYDVQIHGVPQLLDVQGLGWFTADDLPLIKCTPGNLASILELQRWVIARR